MGITRAAKQRLAVRNALGTVLAGLVLASGPALAQEAKRVSEEYDKLVKNARVIGTLGEDLFGDETSFHNGGTTFSVTDISLPGNDSLPVALGRRLVIEERPAHMDYLGGFGRWDIDVPHLSGLFQQSFGWQVNTGTPNNRCSVSNISQAQPRYSTQGFEATDFWHGYSMYVPGAGEQTMLVSDAAGVSKPTTGGPYRWVTSNHWHFSCLPTTKNGYPGEGFLAISPDGTKYWFDWVITKNASNVEKPLGGGGGFPIDPLSAGSATTSSTGARDDEATEGEVGTMASWDKVVMHRSKVFIMATRIEDRFGNWVNYAYTGDRLTGITSGDGRSIAITWSGSNIASATAGGQTWTYAYNGVDLSQVTRPDGSKWTYGYAGALKIWHDRDLFPTTPPTCNEHSVDDNLTGFTLTATHPSGAQGVFEFKAVRHGRTYVPRDCRIQEGDAFYFIPPYSDSFALRSKVISGPGLSTMTWNVAYPHSNHAFADTCTPDFFPCPESKDIELTLPDGSRRVLTFGVRYNENEGQLLRTRTFSGSTLLRDETQAYVTTATVGSHPFPARMGSNPTNRGDKLNTEWVRPLRQRSILQQGTTFGWTVNSFDAWAKPTSVTRASSLGFTRTELTTYHNNLSRWVLGQVTSVQDQGTGLYPVQVAYHATSVLPTSLTQFGQPVQTYAYHADGNLHTVTDARNHTFTLTNYHRGVPRSIAWPTGVSQSATVDAWGRITSVTDVLGSTTSYGYDSMGRLSSITYPTGDSTAWTGTTLSFVQVASPEYGIPAGHWRRTVSTGNQREITYYDGLWRPILTREFDNAAASATSRYSARRFDFAGRTTFTSYPVQSTSSWTSLTQGSRTFYDALGRATRSEQDSELGNLVTQIAYLNGFQKRVTNPRNFQTTYSFQAFDQPDEGAPTLIQMPAGANTEILRDVFGKPRSIRRYGNYGGTALSQTRHYVYGVNQRLCKRVDPEAGASLFAYDAAGNLLWSAEGSPLTSSTSCDRDQVPAGERTHYTHDAMNRLTLTDYPAGTDDVARSYYPDGALHTVTRGAVTLRYEYNKRRLPTNEQMDWGSLLWNSSYAYTGLGHVASLTYPDGLVVDYQPNALGQPTRAGSFASNVSYFPNGAVKQFTYGNGIVHTVTQNTRQLPGRARDAYGATAFVDMETTYDANGNVLGILDQAQAGHQDRAMTYDGLDRLITAFAPNLWGNATYAYDPLDNLRTADVGSRQYRYQYTANNLLSQIRTPTGATVFDFAYDVRGNQTSKGSQAYTWDRANRLLSVVGKANYVYDGLGRRTRHNGNGASNYSYYSQGGQLLYESDLHRAETRNHIHLGSRLVATRQRANANGALTVRYQHTDALGSPVAETGANRAVLSRTEYEPYGLALNRVVDGVGYTGHVADGHSGLIYMQQRYYDPVVGRFLSTDPDPVKTSAAWNFNRYAYAGNNPYRYIDPDGRAVTCTEDQCEARGESVTIVEAAVDVATLGIIYASQLVKNLLSGPEPMQSESTENSGATSDSPPLPEGLVGEQDSGSRTQGGRHNSGPLSEENGGTGNAEADFGKLTGGRSAPAPEGGRYPEGTQIGENGTIYRPASAGSGPRIDVPANGAKPHETLHYPKPRP